MDRRTFIVSSSIAALVAASDRVSAQGSPQEAELNAAFETIFQRFLDISPALVSSLGLDKGARAKIVPFAIDAATLEQGEASARAAGGVVAVRPFLPAVVGAVVQETLGARAMARFEEALSEKVEWFGSTLQAPAFVAAAPDAIAGGISQVLAAGARVIALAGSRPMDPLDPAFEALARLGATLVRQGVPAHPGSLVWLARVGEVPVIGMPACGLFSQATIFDLLLPRLLTGEALGASDLASLGHGGFLTRDMAFRFPPYRQARERGAVE